MSGLSVTMVEVLRVKASPTRTSASATYATPHTSVIVRMVERKPSYCHMPFHQAVLAGVPSVANLRPK